MLRELHVGLAAVTACPEWAVSDDEAQTLAKAWARIVDYYELHKIVGVATHPVAGLARIAWAIYIPRVLAIRMRHAASRARPANAAPPAGLAPPPAAPPPAPQPQAPAAPQAPPPQQQRAAPPPPPRAPIVPQPGHMRAAPIPGFENVTIDVPIPGKPN